MKICKECDSFRNNDKNDNTPNVGLCVFSSPSEMGGKNPVVRFDSWCGKWQEKQNQRTKCREKCRECLFFDFPLNSHVKDLDQVITGLCKKNHPFSRSSDKRGLWPSVNRDKSSCGSFKQKKGKRNAY